MGTGFQARARHAAGGRAGYGAAVGAATGGRWPKQEARATRGFVDREHLVRTAMARSAVHARASGSVHLRFVVALERAQPDLGRKLAAVFASAVYSEATAHRTRFWGIAIGRAKLRMARSGSAAG